MIELSFKLEIFEGPLDLLLSLIQKHKLNIKDIEISVLLEQFLLYLSRMSEADIDIASEFLEMAARLIYIKSAALLPKHEAEQLKKELEGTLIEYAICKQVSIRLRERYVGTDIFVRAPMEIEIDRSYRNRHENEELLAAYLGVSERDRQRARLTPVSMKPIVAHSYVSVFSKVVYVLRHVQRQGTVTVNSLYSGLKRSEQVAVFLALLELSKHSLVEFSEDSATLTFIGKKHKDEHVITDRDVDSDVIPEA